MKLTPSQEKALSTEGHLAITANAGSGKTRVLVRRYVDLFEKFPHLTTRNVAAITFTENAAAELRERIAEEVKERLNIPNITPQTRKQLRNLRDSLRSAFVGTIHSFAARILKEYPVEANVDASFAIVTGADEKLLCEDAIERTFYSSLEEAYLQTGENAVLHLFRTLGRHTVTNIVRTLLSNRQRTERIRKSLLSKKDDEVLSLWSNAIESTASIAIDSQTSDIFHEAQNYTKSGQDGTSLSLAIIAYDQANSFIEKVAVFCVVLNRLLTDKNAIRARAIDLESMPPEFASSFQNWLSHAISSRSLLAAIPASDMEFRSQHSEYLTLMRTAFDLYDQTLLEYHSTKTENGLLDFDDLIERLIRLLEDGQVRSELSREFRFIMIDEYQDTDETQFELAKILTAEFGTENNLAIVGDPKQSIYTFRNADVEVFHTTRRAIDTTGHIELGESFRMSRAPLVAINRLFRDLLETEVSSYSELIHARVGENHGTVEWIAPLKKKKEEQNGEWSEEESEDPDESALIARKIHNIIQNRHGRYNFETKEGVKQPELGDIAILLRSRTSLPLLERSLAANSIPYTVAKGAGFFIQQEIQDIVSYLTFLTSPSHDIALAAILRSPFFALSDVDLFKIASHGAAIKLTHPNSLDFWQKFQSYVHSSKEPYLDRVLSQLAENLTLTGRTTTSFIVEKIFAETGIFASLQAAPQSAQKIANLEKFLALARASDQSGFSSIFDFVERVRYLSDSEEQESQADIPTEQGAVRIMTVHAAKGLEFPIVILPFLQKKFNFTHSNLLDKEFGLQLTFPEEYPEPAIAELIQQRARASTIEEEKRILYVAMTRAKDHLILSCTMPKEPQSNTWLEWICDSVGMPDDSKVSMDETIIHYNAENRERVSEAFHLDIPIIRTSEDIPLLEQEATRAEKPFPTDIHLTPLTISRSPNRFSASQFLRFRECPTKYYLSYILGMPEEPKLAIDEEPADYSEIVRGPLVGQAVHKLMERFERWNSGGGMDEGAFHSQLLSTLDSLDVAEESQRRTIFEAVLGHIQRFLQSPLVDELRSAKTSRSEFILQSILPSGDTLFGILDRLYQDQNGNWTVLDFKTDAVPNSEKYEFQLRFYAYLTHLMLNVPQVRGILFFTATGTATEFNFTDFRGVAEEIGSMIDQIRSLESVADLQTLTRNQLHCPDCHYFERASNQCIVIAAQKPTAIPAI